MTKCSPERLAGLRKRYRNDPSYREALKARAKAWRKAHPKWKRNRDGERRAIAKRFVGEYLATHPCVDCGENHPATLDFDHRNPKRKRYCIGAGWASGILPKSLIKEMRKCDVRCSNCHRKRHYQEIHMEESMPMYERTVGKSMEQDTTLGIGNATLKEILLYRKANLEKELEQINHALAEISK